MARLRLPDECRFDIDHAHRLNGELPSLAEELVRTCQSGRCFEHITPIPIPSRDSVVRIINLGRSILFPGYFGSERLELAGLKDHLHKLLSELGQLLVTQLTWAVSHDCYRFDLPCTNCEGWSHETAETFLKSLPGLRELLADDVRAAYEGDPASVSPDEVIFCYPGLYAISVQRIAHVLYECGAPILPRIMTEHAHGKTGIDIHPGAKIGRSFFIDHGTGVVIGETTEIGDRVRIYQGVTLGALSVPKEQVEALRTQKRHPTIEDDVIVYAGATILGGEAVIGAGSVIGGNVWLTESVPPGTTVLLKNPRQAYVGRRSAASLGPLE